MRRTGRAASALCVGFLASGCALQVKSDIDDASRIARYAMHYDHVVGPEGDIVGRALAECSEKTVKAETACVRQGIDASGLSIPALIAAVPGCRAGRICHDHHATQDRLGFIAANATSYVKHWRVDLDFRHPPARLTDVPATVYDLDDFDAPPPPE